ncbi:MAG: hypothetical protein PHF63_05025 [Herbinix sp.]|nr:hypothetical protein [Herbinix sp.]
MRIDFEYIKNNIEKRNYNFIGSGSGRHVYDLGNGYVVKMAKNKRGLLQNKAEHEIASTNNSRIFARIVAVSKDYHFLIMEKAEKLRSATEILLYYKVDSFRELFRLNDFKDFTEKYNLVLVDLRRLNSWGMIKGKPVIIDYGFTREVRKYYRIF